MSVFVIVFLLVFVYLYLSEAMRVMQTNDAACQSNVVLANFVRLPSQINFTRKVFNDSCCISFFICACICLSCLFQFCIINICICLPVYGCARQLRPSAWSDKSYSLSGTSPAFHVLLCTLFTLSLFPLFFFVLFRLCFYFL